MRYFNFSPETVERFCMWRGFVNGKETDLGKQVVFTKRKYTEVPDGVFIPDDELLKQGIIQVPDNATQEEMQRLQFKALKGFLQGNLNWKIAGYEGVYNNWRLDNRQFKESRDYLNSIAWRTQIIEILDNSPEAEEAISLTEVVSDFGAATTPKTNIETKTVVEDDLLDSPFVNEQKRRGRPAKSQPIIEMEV